MLQMTPLTDGRYRFGGNVGERVENNIGQWLVPAPSANPKMFEMFRLRDRKPVLNQVDWAGEFAGKYLISAVQAARMSDSPALREVIGYTVSQLIACQDTDGYLGPWPAEQRLSAHWDLWGHYHAMLGLLMWYEDTGEQRAYDCALRAADCLCDTFLGEGKLAPADAGWALVNLGVIHVFGRLYRYTGNERYLEFMRLIEREWTREDCGDLLNRGAAGEPYYKVRFDGPFAPGGPPWDGPARWETLHQLQGMVELYRITGEQKYRDAFTNYWYSVQALDVHNTGAFSTNESALGTPFTRGAIETCCQVAWQYMTEDMIALTGDPMAADEMERGFWNGTLGYHHPSGRWSTYNTPCDGVREASAHSIVFQARNGTPELNCCSVNAPRGLGMLTEWALMEDARGALVVNYYGPMEAELRLSNGQVVTVVQETSYPASGDIRLTISGTDAPVRLRIPGWTAKATVSLDGQSAGEPRPGAYFEVGGGGSRVIDLGLEMTLHTWLGGEDYDGCVSIYYGPLLLTFDQKYNPYDCMDLAPFNYDAITAGNLEPVAPPEGPFPPLVLFSLPTGNGQRANLCDFASASVYGTEYRSWLPVADAPPGSPRLKAPEANSTVPAGTVRFSWTGRRGEGDYVLTVATDPAMANVVLKEEGIVANHFYAQDLANDGSRYYWSVTAHNAKGAAESLNGPLAFTASAFLHNDFENPAYHHPRGDGLLTGDHLNGRPEPVYGAVLETRNVAPAADRSGNEGRAIRVADGMVRYAVPPWPEEALSVMLWVRPDAVQNRGLNQILSAWCRASDDPLRITWDGQNSVVNVRFEMGQTGHGMPLGKAAAGTWFHIAIIRDGNAVRTYLNGALSGESVRPPAAILTQAEDFALGANPHHEGHEYFRGSFDDFALYSRALTDAEVSAAYAEGLRLEEE